MSVLSIMWIDTCQYIGIIAQILHVSSIFLKKRQKMTFKGADSGGSLTECLPNSRFCIF